MEKEIFDVAIVGGGPAGYSAAIYAKRYNLKLLLVVKERGGLVTKTHLIENYPGYSSLSGLQLMEKFEEHLKYYNIDITDDMVVDIKEENGIYKLITPNTEYYARSVILATGTKRRELNVLGEKEFYGKGVSYCATCDAMFFRNKIVCVIGGSDSAAKEALVLSEHCKKVYIIYRRGELRAEPINKQRVLEKENIEIVYNTNITEIKGDKLVNRVVLDNPHIGSNELEVQGVFIEIGEIPQSELAEKLGIELSEKKEIKVDKFMKTSKKLVYAAGDVTDFEFRQAIVSASQGGIAAWSAFEDLTKEGNK